MNPLKFPADSMLATEGVTHRTVSVAWGTIQIWEICPNKYGTGMYRRCMETPSLIVPGSVMRNDACPEST